jgi:uncharacterized damage-inducible protein DinB
MRLIATTLLAAATLAAQSGPIVGSAKGMFAQIKDSVLKSADKVPEELWSYQPTPQVRTFAQLFAHEADGQYEFCSAVTGKPVNKNIENTVKGKAAIVAALKEAFAYCDAAFAGMSEADAVTTVNLFGQKMTKIAVMDFNTAHTNEHYGNLVTYMRLKGIVPPTSQK